MSRKITIPSCKECPFIGHTGGFGGVAYVPKCEKVHMKLPYNVGLSGSRAVANPTYEVPDFCPLEVDTVVEDREVRV